MKVETIPRMIGGDTGKRKSNDFYPTPDFVTDYILSKVKFDGPVWEPSCGDGAISKRLIHHGYETKSTDLYDYGYGTPGIDFLKTREPYDNILTNPPFGISTEYTLHGINIVRKKLVLLNKLTLLEGKARRDKLFNLKKLEAVHIYSERVNFSNPNKGGGMLCFAWFVFNKEHNDQPKIYWI